jgi:uncharacterized protein
MSAQKPKHIHDLIATRRALLGGLAGLPLLNLAGCASPSAGRIDIAAGPAPSFTRVGPTNRDIVTVPLGYSAHALVAWGDPLFENMPPFDPNALTRAEQETRWGQNNDMLALFPAEYTFPFPLDAQRYLLCANHEYFEPALMFPDLARTQDLTAAHYQAMFASVGCSVVQIERTGDGWRVMRDAAPRAGRNRRISAFAPVIFSGAAAQHRWITAASAGFNAAEPAGPNAAANEVRCGTMANCAGGRTPWGTYLTSEENFNNGFMLTSADAPGLVEAASDTAWVYASGNFDTPLFSRARVTPAPAQYDISRVPYGPALYGWVVEIDPYDPSWIPRKRTSLGRKKGECANTALTRDGRVAVYTGDDQIDEFVYKFVTSGRFDPAHRTANRDLLDEGQLYAARFNEDGSGDWLKLDLAAINRAVDEAPFHARFEDEADVAIRAREAARLLGATPMDRPEDVEPLIDENWVGRGVTLIACTYNRNEEFYRPGNPRRGAVQESREQQANVAGHILRIDEAGGDCGAERFRWDVFALCGDPDAAADFTLPGGVPADVSVTLGGAPSIAGDRFSCPDNLCIDSANNVWIATDGSDAVFPDCNDCVMVAPVADAAGPKPVKRFLVGPVGSEICGPTLSFDERAFFVSIQHPGENNLDGVSIGELRWGRGEKPPSHFPDGADAWPRAAVVIVTRDDGGKIGT